MTASNSPVVLIPGFTGSRLTTSFDGVDDYPLWLNFECMSSRAVGADQAIQPTDWWLEQMSLGSDGITPLCSPHYNRPVPGLDAISILDPSPGHSEETRYFWNLIQALQRIGYNHSNLRAASYDWRCPPAGLQSRASYFSNLKSTIEDLVSSNPDKTPATIIAHSLGNRLTQYFFEYLLTDERSGQDWIDRNVGRFIAVSALWLGVPKSIREALTGANGLGLTHIDGLKPVYQSYGALPWMLPVTRAQYSYLNTEHFAFLGEAATPLTIGDALAEGAPSTWSFARQYFLEDALFTGKGEELGSLAVRPPPVAHLNVLHATGQDTEIGAYYIRKGNSLQLDGDRSATDPDFLVRNGIRYESATRTVQKIDGTTDSGDSFLPYGSLRYFTIWQEQFPDADISGRAFPGRTHYDILQDESFLSQVVQILQQQA